MRLNKNDSKKSFGNYIVLDNNEIYESTLGSSFYGSEMPMAVSALFKLKKRNEKTEENWGPLH